VHALYWGSDVLDRHPMGVRVKDGRTLADLEVSPIFVPAWQGRAEDVLDLVLHARARTVRAAAIAILKQHDPEALRKLPLAPVRKLLASPHDEVQAFGVELLRGVEGIQNWPLSEWLQLLSVRTVVVAPLVAELVQKHVSPDRLSLEQMVSLACAPVAPIAELGLRWARARPVRGADLPALVKLASAPVVSVRAEAAQWLLQLFTLNEKEAAPEHLRELLDSRFADVREPALRRMQQDARFADSPQLWRALGESPYDDARAFLVKHLDERLKSFEPASLQHVWATTLLAVHRGSRAKGTAVRQIADRIARHPAEADALLPLLGHALRSVRAPERVAAVAERRANDIVYLGRGVSWGLHDRRSKVERLQQLGLPLMSTPKDVAVALGISVKQLRWLAFHAEAVAKPHYVRFEVKKRSGGTRALAAPMPKLAAAQEWVLRNVLDKLPTEATAHGFIRGRSTVTNAREHLGRDLVVNLDLKDFFPTIGFWRVRGVFQRMGYSPAVATVLGLLCTEPPRREVELFGQKLHVSAGDRALPQGACTSPALSNQVARRLDRRLKARAEKLGWKYTRYADDLTFSAPPGKRGELGRLHAMVRHALEDEGFALNPKKGRVQSVANRQTVTGIVVNQKPGVPRQEVRRLRAILHQAKKTGLKAQNRENHPHFEAWLRGKLAYLFMVDPAKGGPMLKALDALTGGK
jgi:retron-type reverse transcriptase